MSGRELKAVVIGSSGQLGQSIQRLAKSKTSCQFQFLTKEALDITDHQAVSDYFNNNDSDIIINCAAYTAVDLAEENQELAEQVNHYAVRQLAEISKKMGTRLIHVSTDYVFDGMNYRPYTENDKTSPRSVYGLTKLRGEKAIEEIQPNGVIIRTSWLYSEFGSNFLKTMLRLGGERENISVVSDQVGSPTYAHDLAVVILDMIDAVFSGTEVYHFSNEGVCSWYDFAHDIFELAGLECIVSPIETNDYPTAAERPHYSVLNKAKIKTKFALHISHWRDALERCISNIKEK